MFIFCKINDTQFTSSLPPAVSASECSPKVCVTTTVCAVINAMLPWCVGLPYIAVQISFTVHAMTLPGGLSINLACGQNLQPRERAGARSPEHAGLPAFLVLPWCELLVFTLKSLRFAPNPNLWNFILLDHKRKWLLVHFQDPSNSAFQPRAEDSVSPHIY